MSFITDMQSNLNEIDVTEDMAMVSPYNLTELQSAGALVRGMKNIEKSQPMHLSNQIQGAGNTGAVLYIQDIGKKKITHLTNKFYLQALDISRRERVQILETFGTPVASFFGETAKIYNFSGVALDWDTRQKGVQKGEYFHATSLMHLYDHFMRGTKLVENNSVAILQILNHSIYGYPLQFSYRSLSDLDKAVQFSFSMFVKDHIYELPGAIDSEMINRNIQMQDVENPLVKKLSTVRESLAPILTSLKYRQDTQWIAIGKSAASSAENIATAVEALTQGDITETDISTAGDVITAARDKYKIKINDYIMLLKDLLPNPPTAEQRSRFGLADLTAITNSQMAWPDFLKTDLNIAWEWMPYAAALNKTASNLQTDPTTTTMLEGELTELLPLEGQAQVDAIKAAGNADKDLGNMAINTLSKLQNVDNMILKRLATFYQNIAAGNSAAASQLTV